MPDTEGTSAGGIDQLTTPLLEAPSITIIEGDVPDDEQTLFAGSALGGSAPSCFDDYLIINRFESDGNRYLSGLTSPDGFDGDQVAFWQLATETMIWICDWTVEVSSEQQPPMPAETAPDGWVFLDKSMTPSSNMVQGDGGTPIWRISGTYVYGAKNPKTVTPFYPRPPWITDTLNRDVSL